MDLERLQEAFQQIRQGGYFPLGWLASVDAAGSPRVRTVKVLGFNWIQRQFYFSCHQRHDKLKHFAAKPEAELCLVAPGVGLQLRLSCSVEVSSDDKTSAMRQRFWETTSPKSKIQLYGTHPRLERPPACFVLVTLHAHEAELLDLHSEEPKRWSFRDLASDRAESRSL